MVDLPKRIQFGVAANLGENSNQSLERKYTMIGGILGQLKESGRSIVIREEADARLASLAITALDLDPLDFIEDYNAPEFADRVEQNRAKEEAVAGKENDIKELVAQYDVLAKEANARYLSTQADNAMQDNAKQLVIAMDTHHQKWAELLMKADKEKTPRPLQPDFGVLSKAAYDLIAQYGPSNAAQVNKRLDQLAVNVKKVAENDGMDEVAQGQPDVMKPF